MYVTAKLVFPQGSYSSQQHIFLNARK